MDPWSIIINNNLETSDHVLYTYLILLIPTKGGFLFIFMATWKL